MNNYKVTSCKHYLGKIYAIQYNNAHLFNESTSAEEDPVIQSLGLRLECKTRRFVTDETQELHFRIEIQNKVYKREVAALDKEIAKLERLLAEPLDTGSLHKRVSFIFNTDIDREVRALLGGNVLA